MEASTITQNEMGKKNEGGQFHICLFGTVHGFPPLDMFHPHLHSTSNFFDIIILVRTKKKQAVPLPEGRPSRRSVIQTFHKKQKDRDHRC